MAVLNVKTASYETHDLEGEFAWLDWFRSNLAPQLIAPMHGMSLSEFIEWRDDFLYHETLNRSAEPSRGVLHSDPMNPSRDGALNRLARLGVPLRPIIETIVDAWAGIKTRSANGDEEEPKERKKLWSNTQCHKDRTILRDGNLSEKWQVIEKWEPGLREFCPGIRITIFETADQSSHVIDRCIPGTRKFAEAQLPLDAREVEWINTTNYPQRDLCETLGITISPDQLTWFSRQLIRIGQGNLERKPADSNKRRERTWAGRIENAELQECALELEGIIRKHAPSNRRCLREIGELLQAAFPDNFKPRDDLSKATAKLIGRAVARGVGPRMFDN